MPWQGDLFIGETVKDKTEAEAVYAKLGIRIEKHDFEEEPDVFNGTGDERFVNFKGRKLRVYVYGMCDSETCEKAVAFNLTDRYKGSVLDIDCVHKDGYRAGEPSGRYDPFIFDPQDLVDVLAQVREWWPDAKVFIWDRFH